VYRTARTLRACQGREVRSSGSGRTDHSNEFGTANGLSEILEFCGKELFNRGHREEKSSLDFGEFDETIFPVEGTRRLVFCVDNNPCRRDLLAQSKAQL
jgi:hypothetical protein